MLETIALIEEWALAFAGSGWVFLVLFAMATIDGFFPPVPSETVVIALAAMAISTGDPNLALVIVVAAAGAFCGDQIAYSIGRRIPVRRMRLMQGARQQRALRWAEQALDRRGAAFIIAARYIPVGRVAVNMTAGTVRFHRPRFSGLAAIAAVTWGIYSTLLGVGAGVWLGEHPLLAVAVGIVAGVALGFVIDTFISWRMRGREAPAPAAEDDGPRVENGAPTVSA